MKQATVFPRLVIYVFLLAACPLFFSCAPEYIMEGSAHFSRQKQGGNSKADNISTIDGEDFGLLIAAGILTSGGKTNEVLLTDLNLKKEDAVPKLQLRTGIKYIGKGLKVKDGIEVRARLSYLEVPIYVVYNYELGPGYLFGGGGPYVAYGIGGKIKANGFEQKSFAENGGGFKNFDAGLGLLAGYRMYNGFSAYLSYELGLANIAYSSQDFSAYNRSLGLTVGYSLNKLFGGGAIGKKKK